MGTSGKKFRSVLILAAILLLSVLSVSLWLVWPQESDTPEDEVSTLRERLRQLSDPGRFRQAYLEAYGGELYLETVQGILVRGSLERNGRSLPFQTIKRRPNKGITTFTMPDHKLSFVVNGDLVWKRVRPPDGAPIDTRITGPEAESLRDMGYFFDPLLHVLMHEPHCIESIIPNIWEGQSCLLVQIDSNSRNLRARVYIDPVRLRPLAQVEVFPEGRQKIRRFSDYRRTEAGRLEPFLVETYFDGKLQSRLVTESFRINPGIIGLIFEYEGENKASP